MIAFFQEFGGQLLFKTWQHIYISAIALFLGVIVAIPLGVLLTRYKKIAGFTIGLASVLQT
ncbi:MAG: choline ABC transporter permease, partial [Loigolactobacillus coryniformis]|nr:choline ABC transporter permease [Loigolactobacillus coryniformis]